MKLIDIAGHNVQYQAIIGGKVYLFAIDVEGTYYMLKWNDDGTLDIL